jgi:hypothetical protein
MWKQRLTWNGSEHKLSGAPVGWEDGNVRNDRVEIDCRFISDA